MRPKICYLCSICIAAASVFIASFATFAETAVTPASSDAEFSNSKSAERGYRVLTEKAVLSSDFTQEVFDNLWKCWPEALRLKAEAASADERREMAFARYGLTPPT